MSILRSAFVAAVVGACCVMPAARADDLAGTVAAKLRESGTLSGYRVNVKAKAGTIWLEGRVADQKQLEAAVILAENTPGVERVVNRLAIGKQAENGSGAAPLGLPSSMWRVVGMPSPAAATPTSGFGSASKSEAKTEAKTGPRASTPAQAVRESQAGPRGLAAAGPQESPTVQLAQALAPAGRSPVQPAPTAASGPRASQDGRPVGAGRPTNTPRPLGMQTARPMQPGGNPGGPQPMQGQAQRSAMRGPVQRTSMRGGMSGDPMHLPAPGGYEGPMQGQGQVPDGQMVPGTMRIVEGGPVNGGYSDGGYSDGGQHAASGGPGYNGGGAGPGGPRPMGSTGVGMPPIPGRADGPNMPNYAWPSYAASPNYAAVQYPTQYSPTAWPYIGPFYPYPQVPLGWRRVSLEWDDGWWWLDFDERHIHSHHR